MDRVVATWRNAHPDWDLTGMALLGRVSRIERLLEVRRLGALRPDGLTTADIDVLASLWRKPAGLRPRDLRRTMMVGSGTLTPRLDRLEAAGWLQRRLDPEDMRGRVLVLTETGTAAGPTTRQATPRRRKPSARRVASNRRRPTCRRSQQAALVNRRRRALNADRFIGLCPRCGDGVRQCADQAAPKRGGVGPTEAERRGMSWCCCDFATDFGVFDPEVGDWRTAARGTARWVVVSLAGPAPGGSRSSGSAGT